MRVFVIFLAIVATALSSEKIDPVKHQLSIYKNRTQRPAVLTTSGGAPVSKSHATSTLNTNLLNNEYFLDLMSNLVRERTPERAVHAKGTGAFGYFEVTHDISHICKANFLNKVGKRTPIAMRFSTATGSKGSSDLTLDNRGFSIKWYTREGNFDIAGFNTPVFAIKEALHGHTIVHTGRRNAATNALDYNMLWDRFTSIPETVHMMMYTYSGRGIPSSYGKTPGFSIHTYQVENVHGERHYIRFHFIPVDGFENLSNEEAKELNDEDYLTKDLYRKIANGDFPSWKAYVQILSDADVEKEGSAVFDVTKIIPEERYPLQEIGKLVLNRNAKNWFSEIDQLAFCPCNVVPGILGGPDKMYQARRLIYRDAQNYRLGGNVRNIPVNCPFRANTYNRDGKPPINGGDAPNYYPNSFNGPQPYGGSCSNMIDICEYEADNLDQARDLYIYGLTAQQRTTLVKNIVSGLKNAISEIQKKAITMFGTIHPDFADHVAKEINATLSYS